MSSNKETLFVISPIGKEGTPDREHANKVYEKIIKPIASTCGYHAERADQSAHSGDITNHIYIQLLNAPIVIAVLTDSNPNVFYELAVRHLLKKPVVQICSKEYMETIPFDIKPIKLLAYPDLDDANAIKAYRRELVRHIKEAREHPEKSNTLLGIVYEQYVSQGFQDQVELFSRSESTRPIGTLTDYYPKVVTLIGEAESSIEILCDYPAYACFSHTESFLKYYRIINQKIRDKKLSFSLTCPDEKHRIENDKDYFRKAFQHWSQWKQENRPKLEELLEINFVSNNSGSIDGLTKANFLSILRELDQKVLQHFKSAKSPIVNCKEIKARNPIDFWIVDDRYAVFAFSSYAKGMSSSSFYTEDRIFITGLKYMRDNYHSRST